MQLTFRNISSYEVSYAIADTVAIYFTFMFLLTKKNSSYKFTWSL